MSTPLPIPTPDPLLDAIASLVVVTDPSGQILQFNRAAEQTTALPRAQALGKPFPDLFPPTASAAADPAAPLETTSPSARHIAWTRTELPQPPGHPPLLVYTGTDVTAARAAELAARDRERFYRRIVETAHEGVWVIDPHGRTLYANPRLADILGYSLGEMAHVTIFDCMDPAEHAPFRARIERSKAGETRTLEWPCLRRDGAQLWTLVTSSPMMDDDGNMIGVLGMITDISEFKRVAQALHETEERFRLAVELSPDAIFFQDPDLRFTWLSRIDPPIRPEDVLGKTDFDVLTPDQAARSTAIKRRVLATGTTERIEVEFDTGEQVRAFDVVIVRRTAPDGRVLGIAGYARDITRRRQVERELAHLNRTLEARVAERTESLRFSDERFRLMVEQAPVSVQILAPDGRTLQVNDAFRRLFGVGAEELANYNILHDPQLVASGALPEIKKAFAGGTGAVPPVPYVPDRGPLTGQTRWAHALIYPVKDDAGRVREVVLVHQDVTDRLAAEERLRESERHFRELAQRNRLLVQEVEHRVGNNLAGLTGLVAMMRTRGVRDVDAFAASIEARLRAMTRVHHMLAGAGWGAVGLRDLVATILSGMGQLAPCAATERTAGPDCPIPSKLALPLALILAEWYTNSCKYGAHSAPGGRLDIHWHTTPAPADDGDQANPTPDDCPRQLHLTWHERGGPAVPHPVTPSVGTELVRAFAATELRGTCTMTYPPTGAHHTIEFTLP